MIGLQTNKSVHLSARNCFIVQREYEPTADDYRMFVHRCQKLRIRKKEGEQVKARAYFRGEIMQIGSVPLRTKDGRLESQIQVLPGVMQASKEEYSIWFISEEQLLYQTDPACKVDGKINMPNAKTRTNILIFEEEERKELAHEIDLWLYEAIAPSTQHDELWQRIMQRAGFAPQEREDPTYRAPIDLVFRHILAIQRAYNQAPATKKRERKIQLPQLTS